MKPTVLMLDEMTPEIKDILAEFVDFKYPDEDSDYSNDFAFVYTGLTPVVTNAPVFCPCTGVDHIDSPNITYLGDEFKNEFSKAVTSTAEHTISLMLQLLKKNKMQIRSKKIGIIGYGRIGKLVHKMLQGFDVTVGYADKEEVWEEGLCAYDVVTIHMPLEESTKGIFNENIINKMKDDALLINTARPGIVDEVAIIQALKQGKLRGYAHDFNPVSERDTDARFHLWYNSGVHHKIIATDHIGGNCYEARKATDAYIVRKILQFIGAI